MCRQLRKTTKRERVCVCVCVCLTRIPLSLSLSFVALSSFTFFFSLSLSSALLFVRRQTRRSIARCLHVCAYVRIGNEDSSSLNLSHFCLTLTIPPCIFVCLCVLICFLCRFTLTRTRAVFSMCVCVCVCVCSARCPSLFLSNSFLFLSSVWSLALSPPHPSFSH